MILFIVYVHLKKRTGFNLCCVIRRCSEEAVLTLKVKVKAGCGSYSTAALRHIVLLTE